MPEGRRVRIMVTMPSEAADDYLLVHNLLQQGMDCMHINCANDEAAGWLRMIEHLRQAERSLGLFCRVVMDLAGPKLRTGPLEPGPADAAIHPRRDVFGRATAPSRVWLTRERSPQPPPTPASTTLPVPSEWLALLRTGECVTFTNAQGTTRRTLKVVNVTDYGCWAEANKTAYIVPGTILHHEHSTGEKSEREGRVGKLPPGENTLSPAAGRPAHPDPRWISSRVAPRPTTVRDKS